MESHTWTGSPRNSLTRNRPTIGSSPYSAFMLVRHEELMKQFNQIDENGDAELSYEEIYNFLSRKQGEAFNETLCRDLFERMDKNGDKVISTDEFLQAYVQAEDVIKQRKKHWESILKDHKKKLELAKAKLAKAKREEVIRSNGIMTDSYLTVKVISALDLDESEGEGYYVSVDCQGKSKETQVVQVRSDPEWDENLIFNIQNPQQSIHIKVIRKNRAQANSEVGVVNLKIRSLKDQTALDKFFTLEGSEESRLHLNLQWIWSKSKYAEDNISEWDRIILRDQKELEFCSSQLEDLMKPFGIISSIQPQTHQQIQSPVSLYTQPSEFQIKLVERFDQITKGKLSEFSHTRGIKRIIYLFLLLSSFCMFYRPDFFSITLGIVSFYYINLKFISSLENRLAGVGMAIGAVADLLWFILVGRHEAGIEMDRPAHWIERAVVFVSVFLFFLKLVLFVVFVRRSSYN